MKSRRRLVRVALAYFVIAAIGEVITWQQGWSLPAVTVLRLVLTVLLALGLALAKNWARWTVVVLSGLAAMGAALMLVMGLLPDSGGPELGPLVFWLPVMVLGEGAIAVYLATTAGVAREIERASMRM